MAAAAVKGIYVIAHHPDRDTSYNEGDPPASFGAYYFAAEDTDTTVEDIINRNAGVFPPNATLIACDQAKAQAFKPEVSLVTTEMP